jgi:hypothetical protein
MEMPFCRTYPDANLRSRWGERRTCSNMNGRPQSEAGLYKIAQANRTIRCTAGSDVIAIVPRLL